MEISDFGIWHSLPKVALFKSTLLPISQVFHSSAEFHGPSMLLIILHYLLWEKKYAWELVYRSCKVDPLPRIHDMVNKMGEQFVSAFLNHCPQAGDEEAHSRLQISITLFYKFVENILQSEKTICADISVSCKWTYIFTVTDFDICRLWLWRISFMSACSLAVSKLYCSHIAVLTNFPGYWKL